MPRRGSTKKQESWQVQGNREEETTEFTPLKSQDLEEEMLWIVSTSRVGSGWAGLNTGKLDRSMTYYTIMFHEDSVVAGWTTDLLERERGGADQQAAMAAG